MGGEEKFKWADGKKKNTSEQITFFAQGDFEEGKGKAKGK